MQETDVFQIQPGWSAYDVRAEKIGVAIERGSTYVLVEKDPLPSADLYIPLSNVSSVNAEEANFIVNLTKDEVATAGWENPPADDSWDVTNTTDSLAIPLREERFDSVRGYVDADENSR